MKLVGRQDDLEVVRSALHVTVHGTKSVLVLHGDAGVGKTALIDAFLDEVAGDVLVLRTDGVESESNMGYAALHRLLGPLMTSADALPGPQHAALSVAFGRMTGPTYERFHVGLAALTLISDAACDARLMCVIDDAHWVDRESLEALAFVARRLHADSVSMLFAVRSDLPTSILHGFPGHTLTGLNDADAVAVLDAVSSRRLAPATASRIAVEAGGNPLALRELARTYSAEQLLAQAARPTPLPMGALLQDRYRQRLDRLPADTQSLLVVLAADQRVDRHVLADAATHLGIDIDVLDHAEKADLISSERSTVRFRHPLIRSACYQAADPSSRRRAHSVLAASFDPEVDPERHAWHLGLAAVATDEATACVVATAARSAGERGARSSQVELLARAAQLTPDRESRARRYLQAAGAATYSADAKRVTQLVEFARSCTQDPLRLAQALHLEALAPVFDRQHAHVPRLLLRAAQALDEFDRDKARAVALECWSVLGIAKDEAIGVTPQDFAAAVRRMPRQSPGQPTVVDLLLDGYVDLILNGWTAAAPSLRDAVRRWPDTMRTPEEIHAYVSVPAWPAFMMWDYDGLRRIIKSEVSITRSAGALNPLRAALIWQRQLETSTGCLQRADITAIEMDDLTVIMDGTDDFHSFAVGDTAAWRGDEATTQTVIAGLRDLVSSQALGTAGHIANLAEAVLANGRRQYATAAAAAAQISSDNTSEYASHALAELAEALFHMDDSDGLNDVLHQIEERASVSVSKIAHGIAARSRALATIGADADDLYRVAIDHLGVTDAAIDLARAHLVYGEWLSRNGRRSEARVHLRNAYERLCDIGADGFAERARTELEDTGERARRRNVSAPRELTSQERQVATLAASGLTNNEIAGQLYVSSRTVDYHLRKVYKKLDVVSRRQLARTTLD